MNDPLLFGLILLSFFLSILIKSAFSSINFLKLELDKKQKNYYAKLLLWIGKNPINISIAINLFYYLNFSILFLFFSYHLLTITQGLNLVYFVALILVPFATYLIRFLGESLSNKVINLFALVIVVLYLLSLPAIVIISFVVFKKNKKVTKQSINKNDIYNKQNLNSLVTEGSESSARDETNSEIKLFKNALDFSETKLRECMTPRTEIIGFEITESIETLHNKFIESGLSKIIVYRDNIDNIIGYVKSKTIFFSDLKIDKSIKTLPIFPESMHANKLLKYFISTHQNIALVVDEFGGTSGLITTEDILEEIFGEITDEHDAESIYEKQLSKNDYVFSGRIEVDHINEKYELNIPENEEYETLAGFILHQTEQIPQTNDIISFNQFKFRILKVSETRLELIKLEIIDK